MQYGQVKVTEVSTPELTTADLSPSEDSASNNNISEATIKKLNAISTSVTLPRKSPRIIVKPLKSAIPGSWQIPPSPIHIAQKVN